MPELRLSITQKQHALVAAAIREQAAAIRNLKATCDAIMAGMENEPAESGLIGVDVQDGVFQLVLNVPDATE